MTSAMQQFCWQSIWSARSCHGSVLTLATALSGAHGLLQVPSLARQHYDHSQHCLPGPLRHMSTSSTSTASPAPEASTSQHDTQAAATTTTHSAGWPNWDWAYVTGHRQGRKPAIKRPQRHQWLFCNPNYDPNQPLPPKMLSPYAPMTAQQHSEQETYRRLKPQHRQKDDQRYRQQYLRWLKLRDVDWREAFRRGMAEEARADARAFRQAKEQRRQQAWAEYKQQLFQQLQGSSQQQLPGSLQSAGSQASQ